jgi:hypothetical protein
MKDTRLIDRRDFAKEASFAFLGGVTVTVAACGGGGYSNPAGGTPPTTLAPAGPSDELGEVSGNHGHQATITSAQIQAGLPITINIEAGAGHPHSVSLPAAAMVDIKAGRPVQLQSTMNNGHDHSVTFNADIQSPPTRY